MGHPNQICQTCIRYARNVSHMPDLYQICQLNEVVKTECCNTEEMKRGINDTNEKLSAMLKEKNTTGMENFSTSRMENLGNRLGVSVNNKDLVAISMDVKALYPSLDWEEIIKLI